MALFIDPLIITTTIILVVSPKSVDSQFQKCPEFCKCTQLTKSVDCQGFFLRNIQNNNIPKSTKNLYYVNNRLHTITKDDFASLDSLEQLQLHGNDIANIEDGSFQNLKSLKFLSLSSNKLKMITTDTFRGLSGLKILWMSNAHGGSSEGLTIMDGAFSDLQNLTTLNLGNNKIQCLTKDTFQGDGLRNLTNPIISFGKIGVIHEDTFDKFSPDIVIQNGGENNFKYCLKTATPSTQKTAPVISVTPTSVMQR